MINYTLTFETFDPQPHKILAVLTHRPCKANRVQALLPPHASHLSTAALPFPGLSCLILDNRALQQGAVPGFVLPGEQRKQEYTEGLGGSV